MSTAIEVEEAFLAAPLDADERLALEAVLDALAACEAAFCDRLYARLFERRPDVRALFGAHSISEQEEMLSETFRSILAWLEREPWLEENLVALGVSHAEYGVEPEMYAPFVALFGECAAETLGRPQDDRGVGLLVRAVDAIATRMARAGAP